MFRNTRPGPKTGHLSRAAAALWLLTLFNPAAQAAPLFAGGQTNTLAVPSAQNLIDKGAPGFGVQDILYGVLNVDNIRSETAELWNANNVTSAPIDAFSGYYVAEIKTVFTGFAADEPFAAVVTLGPAASDPNGKFSASELAAGAAFKLYVDDGAAATPYEVDGSIADDITKATDGQLWASLGFTGTDAYWSALILKDGSIFGAGGVNFINNATGMTFDKVVDSTCTTCGPVDAYFSTVAIDNGSGIWRYSGSTGVNLAPASVPEPGTLALLGLGTLLLSLRRRAGRSLTDTQRSADAAG